MCGEAEASATTNETIAPNKNDVVTNFRRDHQTRPLKQHSLTQDFLEKRPVDPAISSRKSYQPLHPFTPRVPRDLGSENPNQSTVPEGWQAFRDDQNSVVYYHKNTGIWETELSDLYRKPRTRSPEAGSRTVAHPGSQRMSELSENDPRESPNSRNPKKSRRDSYIGSAEAIAPTPDGANSSSVVVTPNDRLPRLPAETIDLRTPSEEEFGADDEDAYLHIEIPETCEFDYEQHQDSDGGRPDDTSNEQSQDLLG